VFSKKTGTLKGSGFFMPAERDLLPYWTLAVGFEGDGAWADAITPMLPRRHW
jgi:hypothetical protein